MDFDERIIGKKHVSQAINCYLSSNFKHAPAKSAFLLHKGKRLPAKYILRLAFKEATGDMPHSETLTGGRASVRVLKSLGFETIYDKPNNIGKRNPTKNKRREAFKSILMRKWGLVETEKKFPSICIPDLSERKSIDPDLHKILCQIEKYRSLSIRGCKNRPLAFDFFLPKLNMAIEFDERQHFTPLRAAALRVYPKEALLGFERVRWIELSETIRAGDNSPAYRDEQRAFYDAIRDIMIPRIGLKPLIRIFEDDVHWEKGEDLGKVAERIFQDIEKIIKV
jgi:hypothetical protein